jgi:hypothetical protein
VRRKHYGTRALAIVMVAIIALVAAGLSFWSRITTPTDQSDINPPEDCCGKLET